MSVLINQIIHLDTKDELIKIIEATNQANDRSKCLHADLELPRAF